MDAAISAFLLRLFRAARSLPHAQLRPWVFEQLQSCIEFDSGFLYRSAVTQEAIDEVPQVAGGMSLYRSEPHPAFTTTDARTFELVMPHVIDAWRENWLREQLPGRGLPAARRERQIRAGPAGRAFASRR